MKKDYIGFTLDLRVLVSLMAQDPQCRAEIEAGLAESNAPTTSSLGAANTGTKEAPEWSTLFASAVEGKQPGEAGMFYRNSSQGVAGNRVQMRLKKQTQQYNRPAQQQYQVSTPVRSQFATGTQAETEAAVAQLHATDPVLFAKLLEEVNQQQGAGQLATVAESVPDGPSIPDDIQHLLNNAG